MDFTGHTHLVLALQLVDVVGFGAIFGVCALMLWVASRIEPHWVSKDLTRFMTSGQELDQFATPVGRRTEMRVSVDQQSGALVVTKRAMLRQKQSSWMVRGKVPDPPKGKQVFLLDTLDENATVRQMLLRFPDNSKMLPVMDRILDGSFESDVPLED